jgi:hypothetical protein
LVHQIIQFKRSFENQILKLNSVHDLAKFIIIDNYLIVASFPDLCTACFLFLTIPLMVASAERSFSKLKIIKNHLRSTMSQIRLSSLAIISIEKKIAKEINTSNIISTLANKKSKNMFKVLSFIFILFVICYNCYNCLLIFLVCTNYTKVLKLTINIHY